MNAPIALLEALGVRVRYTNDLDEGGVWLPTQKILLLDINLDDEQINDVIDQVLPELFEAGNHV